MSVILRVPYSMRNLIGDVEETECVGNTIGECLDGLSEKFPGLKNKLQYEKGEINGSVLVFLNGKSIRSQKGTETPVKDGDEISIVPLAAGG